MKFSSNLLKCEPSSPNSEKFETSFKPRTKSSPCSPISVDLQIQDREVEGENAGSSVKPEQTKGDGDGRGNGYTYARAGALVRGGKHLDAEAEQEGKVDEEESGLIRSEGKAFQGGLLVNK